MPTYAYICEACGHALEVQRPSSERDQLPRCPRCAGGPTMRRDFRAEQGHMRTGDLPDWVSVNAGVMVPDVARANRHYAPMGVKFDPQTGHAHVPGNKRRAFLKERGLCELS